ncbi:DNA polymerase-3 subunit epsilon [Litorimonas taeanensis]|uniref:DNA polymerase III subunit epsilon n=1 Tax=Litorimonas taeanensis TaxID=568099 RepID=A0A420WEK8_9PROT|nr:DNA polymerase III subunit epsilon [Litorimonas taeanensis]RKQ69438.1 DNA polymerase-3 subunit epsilon [Litorimonas taeanensis]
MSGKREIVFDTETTGFDAKGADRITEIGCIEIIDLLPTGEQFHTYLDPERDVPDKVVEITGLTTEFLRGKAKFKEQAQAFLDFVGQDTLVAHNARFDEGFINAELVRAGYDPIPSSQFKDTLAMANAQFPGSPASLDALCRRFDISLSSRDKHGAIVDSELLAAVYLELNGGRARLLGLDGEKAKPHNPYRNASASMARQRPTALPSSLTEAERLAHKEFIASLGEDMIWQKYWSRQGQ